MPPPAVVWEDEAGWPANYLVTAGQLGGQAAERPSGWRLTGRGCAAGRLAAGQPAVGDE